MEFFHLLASLFLFFGLCQADLIGQDSSKYLRQKQDGARVEDNSSFDLNQSHRTLATFRVPFDFELTLKTTTDRQPTSAEYTSVSQATTSWWDASNKVYYANGKVPGLTYTSSSCPIKSKTYTSSSSDGFQHKLVLACEIVFSAAQASVVPATDKYVLEANQNFSFQGFATQYMINSGSASNIFRTTRNVRYDINYVAPVPSSTVPRPAPTPANRPPTSAPVMRPPTMKPVSSPSAPAPVMRPPTMRPVSAPVPTASAIVRGDIALIPIKMQFDFLLGGTDANGDSIPDRRPTDAEYSAWLGKTRGWMATVLKNKFNGDPNTPSFVGLVNMAITSKTYTAGLTPYSHSVVVDLDLKLKLGPGQGVPYMYVWVRALRDAGLTGYRTDYLYGLPSSNVFRGVQGVKWAALDP